MDRLFLIVENGCSYEYFKRYLRNNGLTMENVNKHRNRKNQNIAHIICKYGNIRLLEYYKKFEFDEIDQEGNKPIYYMLGFISKKQKRVGILQSLLSYGLLNNKILEHENKNGEKIKYLLEEIVKKSSFETDTNIYKNTNIYTNSIDIDEYSMDEQDSYFQSFESDTNYETFDQWCDRMSREFRQKYTYTKPLNVNKKINENKKTNGKENINENQKTNENMNKIKDLNKDFEKYMKKLKEFDNKHLKLGLEKKLTIYDIPWLEKLPINILKMNNDEIINVCKRTSEKMFELVYSNDKYSNYNKLKEKDNLKFQRIFWHPDKFQTKYGSFIEQDQKELIFQLALNMSQLINTIYKQIKN